MACQEITSELVVEGYIKRAREINSYVNAIIEERFDAALEDAKKVDKFLQTTLLTDTEIKEKFPLLGLPITVKGSLAVGGIIHHSGVVERNDFIAMEDAVIVRYAKEAGAIPILSSNVPELCMHWETTNKLIGTTKNPYNTTKTAGGSSGGEASLLSAAASVIGLGSDIAGSLRLPAHFCGVWGHKPSPKIVSSVGHYPDCQNRDEWESIFTLGPLVRYAVDLKLMLNVIVEPEFRSKLQLFEPVDLGKLKYYYIDDFNSPLMTKPSKSIQTALSQVVAYFNRYTKVETAKVDIPLLRYASLLAYLRLLDLDDVENLFGGKGEGAYLELLRFITFQSKSHLNSICYGILRKHRDSLPDKWMVKVYDKLNELKNQLIQILGDDGVLFCPIFTDEAHPHGDVYRKLFDPGYMAIFNALGFPATCCPVMFTKGGLPVGIQVVTAPLCDRLALSVAEELEKQFGGWQPCENIIT